MSEAKFKAAIKKTCAGHTDLNIFAVIVSVLEGGHLYDTTSQGAAGRIIRICQTEQSRLLRVHDAGVAAIKGTPAHD